LTSTDFIAILALQKTENRCQRTEDGISDYQKLVEHCFDIIKLGCEIPPHGGDLERNILFLR
jgi:hypothetical protein